MRCRRWRPAAVAVLLTAAAHATTGAAARHKVQQAPEPLKMAGQWVSEWVKRASARKEEPLPLLRAMLETAAEEEERVRAFLQSSRCNRVLIDVGEDPETMLSSVYEPSRARSPSPDWRAEVPLTGPQLVSSSAGLQALLTRALGPAPRCGVCAIVLATRSVDDSHASATALLRRLRARGIGILVSTGAAGAGTGMLTTPQLRRVVDLASLVHAAARDKPSGSRIIVRLGSAHHNPVLLSHLIVSQALCRTHTVLLAWRAADMPQTLHSPSRGSRTLVDGRRLAGASADGSCPRPCAECARPCASSASSWCDWTQSAVASALSYPHSGRGCKTMFYHVPADDIDPPQAASSPTLPQQRSDCTALAAASLQLPSAGKSLTSYRPVTVEASGGSTKDLSAIAQTAAEEWSHIESMFAASRCTHAYLDVGTNIGVQIRKLYEPHKYRGASVLPIFADHFGPHRCRVCAIGIEPNPRHNDRLVRLQTVLRRAGAPVIVLRGVAATTQTGVLQLARARDVKDRYQDVGASAAPSQGNFQVEPNVSVGSRSQVLVRTLDLSELIARVSRLVKKRDGKLLMKMDVEGSEFTLIPALALSGTLCAIDTMFIEWHHRYYQGRDVERVVEGLRLTNQTDGKGALSKFLNLMPTALGKALETCRGTKVITLDDESYMNDLQPWPSREDQMNLCNRRPEKEPGPDELSWYQKWGSASDLEPVYSDDGSAIKWHRSGEHWLVRAWMVVVRSIARLTSYVVMLHDEFEDEGLLWLLYFMATTAGLSFCFCVHQFYSLLCGSVDDDADQAGICCAGDDAEDDY